jgi:phosphoglycolate phosphatase
MKQLQKTIIWDWNGTLLDDLDICIESINSMLAQRHLEILSHDMYRKVFTFPVIDYYRVVGFDFEREDWKKVGMEFMDHYFERLKLCALFPDVITTLDYFEKHGYRQVILSAMEQGALTASVNERGIGSYFKQIAGIDNHYAAGKSGNGHTMMDTHSLVPESTWFVGDTLHDADIARELGCHCILIANGHQDKSRLAKAGVPVMDSLTELVGHFAATEHPEN